MMPQSPSKQAPWDLTQFSQSPSAALSYFPEFHQWSEISSLSKVILVLGKARSHRAPNLGLSRAESPGWLDVFPKTSAWHVMREEVHCHDEAATHQLPTASAFWIMWIVSMEECSSLTQNLQDTRNIVHRTMTSQWCRLVALLAQSFWMPWPHSTHAPSIGRVYHPHWLV